MYTFMIADDEKAIRESIPKVIDIEKYGFSLCATARDGEEALCKAKELQPDLVLLDYEMPGMDGNATFQKLLECNETKNIPVIFLTSVSDGRKVREVLDKHPAGYILKTLDTDKLISKLEEVLALRK